MAILNHQRVYNIIVLFLDKVQYKPNSYLKKRLILIDNFDNLNNYHIVISNYAYMIIVSVINNEYLYRYITQ